MLGENLTQCLILCEFAGLLVFAFCSAWMTYTKGWSAMQPGRRGGVVCLLSYLVFVLPVFASRKYEFAVNMHDGLYAQLYWLLHQPAIVAISYLAYFGRTGLLDQPLLMHPFIVVFSGFICVGLGMLCGQLLSHTRLGLRGQRFTIYTSVMTRTGRKIINALWPGRRE
jgi:hypothetical protein